MSTINHPPRVRILVRKRIRVREQALPGWSDFVAVKDSEFLANEVRDTRVTRLYLGTIVRCGVPEFQTDRLKPSGGGLVLRARVNLHLPAVIDRRDTVVSERPPAGACN